MEMNEQEFVAELLSFFKALADENRLKIVGLLAQRPYSVENLAQTLGLSASTTSHHLARLAKAGLVSARADGHYYHYSLDVDALQRLAQRLLQKENLPILSGVGAEAPEGDSAYDRKVMAAFVDAEGRIKDFPAQEKKYLVILRYVLKAFEPGIRYPEKQVNEILARYNEDTAMLRRSLVEYAMMAREGGGGEYWVNE